MYDFETFLRTVATSAWPRPMQSDRESCVTYCWFVTFPRMIEEPLDALQEVVGAAAEEGMQQAKRDAGADSGSARPRITLRTIDPLHMLLCVDVPSDDQLNSWLVASTWALRTLNERHAIADLQGLPRRFWLILNM